MFAQPAGCNRLSAVVALFFLSISWGLTGIIRRLLEHDLDPLLQLALQSLGAAALLLVVSRCSGMSAYPRLSRNALALIHVRVLLGGVLAITLILYSYSHASIALVSWITALPGSVLWARLLHQQRATLIEALLLGVGLIGIWCVAGAETDAISASALTALLGTLLFTLGLSTSRAIVSEIGAFGAASWSLSLTGVYSIILAFLFGSTLPSASSGCWSILCLSSTLVAANTFLQMYGFAFVRPALASTIANLRIFWAPLAAVLFFNELPPETSWFGMLLLCSSVVLAPVLTARRGQAS